MSGIKQTINNLVMRIYFTKYKKELKNQFIFSVDIFFDRFISTIEVLFVFFICILINALNLFQKNDIRKLLFKTLINQNFGK